jgi:hypothetical protein
VLHKTGRFGLYVFTVDFGRALRRSHRSWNMEAIERMGFNGKTVRVRLFEWH